MDVTPRFLAEGSFLSRRDPRILILVPALTVAAAAQVHDPRLMIILTVLAFGYYLLSGIGFRRVWRNWAIVGVFVLVLATLNGLVVGATRADQAGDSPVFGELPLFGLPITGYSVSYAVTLMLRFLTIATTGFPLAFAMRPGDLAVAFARLGLPARFAYGIDLTFRFLPSAATALRETKEAQRLRGFEPPPTRNPVRRLMNVKPLMIPLTVNSLIDAEEVADALDLRAFGTGKRTWLRVLRMQLTDWVLLGFVLLLAALATVINISRIDLLPSMW